MHCHAQCSCQEIRDLKLQMRMLELPATPAAPMSWLRISAWKSLLRSTWFDKKIAQTAAARTFIPLVRRTKSLHQGLFSLIQVLLHDKIHFWMWNNVIFDFVVVEGTGVYGRGSRTKPDPSKVYRGLSRRRKVPISWEGFSPKVMRRCLNFQRQLTCHAAFHIAL